MSLFRLSAPKASHISCLRLCALALGTWCASATAGDVFILDDGSGLSAEVEFTLLSATSLEVRARNTSTGIPMGADAADQILSGVSWDFGHPGFNGDTMISGGMVVIGAASDSVNFDTGSYGPGFDVSGEYGFGNMDGTGALTNFVSSNTAQATPFGGANLDGPVSIDGPQGGLVADPMVQSLGGLGAIQDEYVATLTLTDPITDLDFLTANGVRVEFGSDYRWITIPEPASAALLMLGSLLALQRRKRQ